MGAVNYIWDPDEDNVIMEVDDEGNILVEYTTEPFYHGDVISQYRDGKTYTYHYDGQGSTLALTDDSGEVTDTYAYNAFGEITASTGTTENPYRYIGRQGYYYDKETNDYYVRRRGYRPTIARWLSTDPMLFIDGMNLYSYVVNDPGNLIDSSGLEPQTNHEQLPNQDYCNRPIFDNYCLYKLKKIIGGGNPELRCKFFSEKDVLAGKVVCHERCTVGGLLCNKKFTWEEKSNDKLVCRVEGALIGCDKCPNGGIPSPKPF